MNRPDLTGVDATQLRYIEWLETEVEKTRINGMMALFISINQKMLDMALAVDNAKIDLAGDDKTVERIVKLSVESKDIFENMSYMKEKLGITDLKATIESVNKKKSPLEQRAKQGTR